MNIIETHNLTRRFGRNEAVHDLTFAVAEGSVCALLGPNGAGKSTTIKVLMNLLRPTAGAARRRPSRRRVRVPETPTR